MIGLLILQIVLLLWLSAICSGSENGLYALSRVKLRYRLRRSEPRAMIVDRLLASFDTTIIALLIANTLCAEALARLLEQHFDQHLGGAWSIIITVVILTPLVLICAEYLPKHLFRRHADNWIYALAYFLRLLTLVLSPLLYLIRGLTHAVHLALGGSREDYWEPHLSRPNLRTFLSTANNKHNLTPVQQQLIDRILAMERIDLSYQDVARPVSDIVALDAGASLAAVRQNLGPTYYQRYLVRDHQDAQPTGYISAVHLVIGPDQARVEDFAQTLPTMRITTPVHTALQKMHAAGSDMALVVDEQGQAMRIAFRSDCLRLLTRLR